MNDRHETPRQESASAEAGPSDAGGISFALDFPAESGDWPALHRAVLRRSLWELFAALDSGVAPDFPARGGFTALHLAVRTGWRDGVRALLDAGADPRAATSSRRITPVHIAAHLGHADILHDLLGRWRVELVVNGPLRGYRPPEGVASPLYLALAEGHGACVRLLREVGHPRCANRLVCADTPQGHAWLPISALYSARAREAEAFGDTVTLAELRFCLDAISGHPGNLASPALPELPRAFHIHTPARHDHAPHRNT